MVRLSRGGREEVDGGGDAVRMDAARETETDQGKSKLLTCVFVAHGEGEGELVFSDLVW